MPLAFPAPPTPTAPMADGADFPVRRIFCVGRNYAAHAREMGGDPDREPPFFFSKPADAVVRTGAALPYPSITAELHHEVELVVALGSGGSDLSPEAASACIFGYAVGVDLTRRDLQNTLRKGGRPWDMAKGFDGSAPCGPIVRAEGPAPKQGAVWLKVNGEPRQSGDLADLVWPIPELLAELSRYVELKAGDLVYTGTPEGVGPLQPGDHVLCHVDGVPELAFSVAARG